MKRIVALVLWLTLSGISLPADDREIARAYVLRARHLADRGASEDARRLLLESIDLYPEYSETLFLLGKLDCVAQSTTAEGITLLERALSENNWYDTPPSTAREMLGHAYVRTRRYREALTLLNGLKKERLSSPAIEMSRALAAAGLRDHRQADAIWEAAERVFPEERSLLLAHIGQLVARGVRNGATVLVERGLREFPDEPGFLFYKIKLLSKPGEKKALFDAYQARGGRDPRILLALIDTDRETFKRAVDFSVNLKAAEDVYLLEALAAKLRGDKVKFNLILSLAGAGNGVKTVDADADGFYEEQYELADGEVTRVLFDRDQNGIVEREVLLEKNRPVSIILRRAPGKETQYRYRNYPRLTEIIFQSGEGTLTYQLIPDRLLFSPVKNTPVPADLKIRLSFPAGTAFPDEKSAARQAWALIEEPADGKQPRRKWDIFGGRKLVLHEDSDRNGRYERTVFFNDRNEALRGMVDNDGDGYAEIREWYEKGRLIRREYDGDRDGRPEYQENAASGSREWDLDGDGIVDVKERKLPNGKTVWEYEGILRGAK